MKYIKVEWNDSKFNCHKNHFFIRYILSSDLIKASLITLWHIFSFISLERKNKWEKLKSISEVSHTILRNPHIKKASLLPGGKQLRKFSNNCELHQQNSPDASLSFINIRLRVEIVVLISGLLPSVYGLRKEGTDPGLWHLYC